MSTEFLDILDSALERLTKRDSIPKILERYPDLAENLAPLLYSAEALKTIQTVEMPSDAMMGMDRTEFLMSIAHTESPSVHSGLLDYLKEQMRFFIHRIRFGYPFVQKEKRNMRLIFARTMLVLILFFGLTGGAYALTESSLPDSPLYETKLAMEQMQLQMKTDPADVAGQHLILAQNRVQEIIHLAQARKVPDEGVIKALENHLNLALQSAAQLGDDSELQDMLTQAKTILEEQNQVLTQTRAHVTGSATGPLQLAIQLLNGVQNQVEAGLQDPNAFREQYQYGFHPDQPGSNPDCPNCPCINCEPAGVQSQNQNQEQNLNQNGQEIEEGAPASPSDDLDCPDCACIECEPVDVQDQDQDRNQDKGQDQDRNQNQAGQQTGEGTSGGSGSSNNSGGQEGRGNQNGPQPDQPGPGGGGGNPGSPNCPCEDSESGGGQNQNGPRPK